MNFILWLLKRRIKHNRADGMAVIDPSRKHTIIIKGRYELTELSQFKAEFARLKESDPWKSSS